MPIGSLLVWLLVGLVAGVFASIIVPGRAPSGAVGAIAAGLIGGILGGGFLDMLGITFGYTLMGSLVVATLGAVIMLYVLRAANT